MLLHNLNQPRNDSRMRDVERSQACRTMISPKNADALASKLVNEFLSECDPDTLTQTADALVRLIGVAGHALTRTVGHERAVLRLLDVATLVGKPPAAAPEGFVGNDSPGAILH